MELDLAALPQDVDALHRLIRELAAKQASEHKALTAAQAEIERLRVIVKKLQRHQFGQRAERLADGQLELGLEDLGADIARAEQLLPVLPVAQEPAAPDRADRPSLPDHLEREELNLDLEVKACPCCGGALHVAGETVSEMLDWVPARLRVIRICRPKYGCRSCGKLHQAAAPERPIAKGLATPGLLAHVLVSKYCDHLPLYRQSQMFARQGVELDRSTLANWVGGAAWWLEPLRDRLAEHVFGSQKLFADDTPIPVRSGPWPDQDREAVGLCAGRSTVGRVRPAGGGLLLQPRSQGRASGRASGAVQGRAAGRWLSGVRAAGAEGHRAGGLRGAHQTEVLRGA